MSEPKQGQKLRFFIFGHSIEVIHFALGIQPSQKFWTWSLQLYVPAFLETAEFQMVF